METRHVHKGRNGILFEGSEECCIVCDEEKERKVMETVTRTEPDLILGINHRCYKAPGWVEVPITVVLVSGAIGDYAAYISAGDDPEWTRRHGDKLKFEEAQVHFCNCLEREKYRD